MLKQNILAELLVAPNEEIVKQDALGGLVIISLVGPSKGRKHFERKLLEVSLAGLKGWERAHSQGNITGHESAEGIAYAPREVNQALQRLGIEKYIRQWLDAKTLDIEIVLTTVTYLHNEKASGKEQKGNRLKEIVYKVEAMELKSKFSKLIFEGWITVDDNKINPRTTCGVGYHFDYGAF